MTFRFKMPPARRRWLALAAIACVLTATAAGASAGAAARAATPARSDAAQVAAPAGASPLQAAGQLGAQPACTSAGPGYAACQAIVDTGVHWDGRAWSTGAAPAHRPLTSPQATSAATASLAPYMASDLQSAYNLPSSLLGSRQTIAIVDAYDDPFAATDLATYRQANNLPACDTDFPCFTKVNQEGQQGSYPQADSSWAVEESLDLDMASAICPNCKLILVEADDDSIANLAAAANEAAALGANVISNSYGGSEFTGESAFAADYSHPGVAVTASSGDSAFEPAGAQVPASYASVTAVGGTALYWAATARGWSESAWYSFPAADQGASAADGAGSGCSAYIPKPAWQHDPLCGMRTTADVAAVADPDTPVAVYDVQAGGWIAVGGTSVAAPIIAGVYALAGNAASIGPGASWVYAHHSDLYDISGLAGTTGSGDCGGSYLCVSGPGYDGPTGWGTPDGIGAF